MCWRSGIEESPQMNTDGHRLDSSQKNSEPRIHPGERRWSRRLRHVSSHLYLYYNRSTCCHNNNIAAEANVSSFGHSGFGFDSDFGIRISDLRRYSAALCSSVAISREQ